MNEVLYSVDEVAQKVDVHSRTIRRYIASGELNAIRVGRKWMVKKEDLTTFINDRNPVTRSHHNHVKEDDLCVFLDKGQFNPNCRLQACTVVDVRADSKETLDLLIADLEAVLSAEHVNHCVVSRMEHIYLSKEDKLRIVIWGEPQLISEAMMVIDQHIKACD